MIVCDPITGVCKEIVESRENLDSWRYSYLVKDAGPDRYGIDVIMAETPKYDLNKMCLWIPIADGARRDGVGDRIRIEGIDLERHMKNPLFLFDHGKEKKLPLGSFRERDTGVYTVQKDLVAGTMGGWGYFYQGKDADNLGNGKASKSEQYDHALFCEQTFDMAVKCLINGGSIGYQVKRAQEIPPDYERGTPKGLDLIATLMLEGSLVILPANMDTVNKFLVDNFCCGKTLDHVLYKSLEYFSDKHTIQATVPADVRTGGKIPPARWNPGLGAVTKALEVLHPDQDHYRSLIAADAPLSAKVKALYHVKSLRSRYSKKSLESDLRQVGIRARSGDVASWSNEQKQEVMQWLNSGGQEPECIRNLPHVKPDHIVGDKSLPGKYKKQSRPVNTGRHSEPGRFGQNNKLPNPGMEAENWGQLDHTEDYNGWPEGTEDWGEEEKLLKYLVKAHGSGPFQGPSGRWFIMKQGRPVPFKRGAEGGSPKVPGKAPAKGKPKAPQHPKVATTAAKTEEELVTVDKAEKEAPKAGPISKDPPVIPAKYKQPGAADAFVVDSRIGGYVPKVGPVHHSSVVICPKGEPAVIQDGSMPKSNPGCISVGLQPGVETFQIEPQRINATAEPAGVDASVVIDRIEKFRKPYSLLSNNCQHSAAEVTRIKSLRRKYKSMEAMSQKSMSTNLRNQSGSTPEDSQEQLIKSLRDKYRTKSIDWLYWGQLALRVLTDRGVAQSVGKLPGYAKVIRNLFDRGLDPQAAADVIAKLWVAHRNEAEGRTYSRGRYQRLRNYDDYEPPNDLFDWVKCLDRMHHNGKALGVESKRLLTKMIYNKDLGRDIVEANMILANPEEAHTKGLSSIRYKGVGQIAKQAAQTARANPRAFARGASGVVKRGVAATTNIIRENPKNAVAAAAGTGALVGMNVQERLSKKKELEADGHKGVVSGATAAIRKVGTSMIKLGRVGVKPGGKINAVRGAVMKTGQAISKNPGKAAAAAAAPVAAYAAGNVRGRIQQAGPDYDGKNLEADGRKACTCHEKKDLPNEAEKAGFAGTVSGFTPAANKVTNAVSKVSSALRGGGQAIAKPAGRLMGQASGFRPRVKGIGESVANTALETLGADPVKSLRQKYRTSVRNKIKRLKNSKAGATMLRVHEKDLEAAQGLAKSHGLQCTHMGNGKIKLIGDNSKADDVAKKYGRKWK